MPPYERFKALCPNCKSWRGSRPRNSTKQPPSKAKDKIMMVYAYIVLSACLIAAIVYICVLRRRITKLNEYIKRLDARTKDVLVERTIHNLANEIISGGCINELDYDWRH